MIVDQLFNPKPLKENGPYDLPGIDYDRPGDTPRKPRPQGSTTPRRHDNEPDFMDPDQRRLRADQARVKQAQDEYHAKKKPVNEAMLMEDPVYRNFKRVGRYIAEQKLTEPEILQIFSDAEASMTDKATGANRTWTGRGKDATVDFAKDVAGAGSEVLNSIQNSVPVAAVDTAYDQATDALGDLTGGQKGQVMDAIKKYRNLVKEYPKTAGFAKAALVAIAGLATGGAGLPAIAGLTYALDSAIKGDKLSSVIGKGAGAAALAAAGQAIHGGATQTGPADTNAFTNVNNMGDHTGEYVSMPDGSDVVSPLVAPPPELATYTVQSGDTLSQIAQANNTTVQELVGLNPQLAAASGATGGQGLNPDVIFPGQQITLPPATPGADVYAGAVGTNADTMADIARGQVPNSAITQGMAARNAVRESIKYRARILPADKLIDQKATVLNWALSESVGHRSRSVNLTTIGTYTVFENIDRYRLALLERAETQPMTQPGRPELPDQYRPDMPGGAGVQSQPGMIGRGLNWLDNKTKAVGGALSNFGHQFTTNVTKEKLKMNWHQAGKPTDSDQLAAWLVGQDVPQQVVTSVFGKMGIPYTAPAAEPTAQPADQSAEPIATSTTARQMPWYGKNASGNVRDSEALRARGNTELAKRGLSNMASATSQVAKDMIAQTGGEPLLSQPTATTTATAPGATTGTTAPTGFNAANMMKLPGMEKYAKSTSAPAAKPLNFAGPGGYSKVTQTFKPTAPATSTGTKVTAGGPTADEKAKLDQRIAQALKQPVAEMLQMVETKEDVQKIKQFVDQTFTKYGAVNESAFAVRNQILEHITQVGAQRRREHSQKVAH
jgi:LysM repeat protein